jgi:anti-anti-sigma regulatory factor
MLGSVLRSGIATWSDDLLLTLVNDGRRLERYFTFTYSPIVGGDGRVEGVFCAVAETTERVLGERRLQALNALAAALLDAHSSDSVLAAAVQVCAAHDADLPFAAVYLTDGPPSEARAYLVTPSAAGLLPESLAPLLDAADADGDQDGLCVAGGLRSRLPGLEARFGDLCPEQALVMPVSEPIGGEPGAVHARHPDHDHVPYQQSRSLQEAVSTTSFELSSATGDGQAIPVVQVRGEIDVTNAAGLHEALAPLASPALVVDLSSVGYFDSAGFAVLDQLLSQAPVAVVAPPGSVVRTAMSLLNLPFHDRFDPVQDALAAR